MRNRTCGAVWELLASDAGPVPGSHSSGEAVTTLAIPSQPGHDCCSSHLPRTSKNMHSMLFNYPEQACLSEREGGKSYSDTLAQDQRAAICCRLFSQPEQGTGTVLTARLAEG